MAARRIARSLSILRSSLGISRIRWSSSLPKQQVLVEEENLGIWKEVILIVAIPVAYFAWTISSTGIRNKVEVGIGFKQNIEEWWEQYVTEESEETQKMLEDRLRAKQKEFYEYQKTQKHATKYQKTLDFTGQLQNTPVSREQ